MPNKATRRMDDDIRRWCARLYSCIIFISGLICAAEYAVCPDVSLCHVLADYVLLVYL